MYFYTEWKRRRLTICLFINLFMTISRILVRWQQWTRCSRGGKNRSSNRSRVIRKKYWYSFVRKTSKQRSTQASRPWFSFFRAFWKKERCKKEGHRISGNVDRCRVVPRLANEFSIVFSKFRKSYQKVIIRRKFEQLEIFFFFFFLSIKSTARFKLRERFSFDLPAREIILFTVEIPSRME